jgi:hypothetical protein
MLQKPRSGTVQPHQAGHGHLEFTDKVSRKVLWPPPSLAKSLRKISKRMNPAPLSQNDLCGAHMKPDILAMDRLRKG